MAGVKLTRAEKEVILQRFKMSISLYIETHNLKNMYSDVLEEFDTENIVLMLFNRPFGEIIDKIQYPKNWKESVKDAFYDWTNSICNNFTAGSRILAWLKAKHPVKYKVYDVKVYYPNISIPDEEHVVTFVRK